MGIGTYMGVEAMLSGINNLLGLGIGNYNREENYYYSERQAENADKRTRALYADLYSPQALMQQYKKAGLSPSLMFGGTPGQGGMSGAQGASAAVQTPYMPMSLLEAAQIKQLEAETEKTKAEASNINQDTKLKELQEDWQRMQNQEHSVEFDLTTTYLENKETGQHTSLYELANQCHDYDEFLRRSREMATGEAEKQIGTELGQKVMREIFMNANRFDRDISVLSAEGVSADFQKKLISLLDQKGYAEQSAETAFKQAEAAAEVADLTKEQKGAWNNILERLRKTNGTAADIIIVASMILNQAASSWGLPAIHNHNNYRTTNTYEL